MLKAYFHKGSIECGLDEVGRGCLAGPVVAAAVILPLNHGIKALNDSKKLLKEERDSLTEEIKNKALAFAIAECSAREIEEVNILNASILAMHRAVDLLKLKPEHLLVDGNKFKPYLSIPHTCIIKGDGKFQSIAAASILAKTYRDQLMNDLSKQYPVYSWNTNVGYPTIAHRKAILEFGDCIHHRKTFKVRPISLKSTK